MKGSIYMIILAFLNSVDIEVYSLKLTPVQQLTQRIDLFSESKSIQLSLQNAIRLQKRLIYDYFDNRSELIVGEECKKEGVSRVDQFLHSEEVLRLIHVIKRWSYIEDKLRHAISPNSMQHVRFRTIFDDYKHLHNISNRFLRTLFIMLHLVML